MIYVLQEQRTQGSEVDDIHYRLEQALIDVKNSRKKEFEEAIKRWKEEDNSLNAKQNASLLPVSLSYFSFFLIYVSLIVLSWKMFLSSIASQSRKHDDQLELICLYFILQNVVWCNFYKFHYLILQYFESFSHVVG